MLKADIFFFFTISEFENLVAHLKLGGISIIIDKPLVIVNYMLFIFYHQFYK